MRQAANKDITKWQPTLFFDQDVDLRTEFEKKMASLVNQSEAVEVSIEDVEEKQAHNAKIPSLLFRHEMKAKRIKKIKSKTFRGQLKKDRKKAAEASIQIAAEEQALRQEFKRAEERLTLRHKNNSKWTKRILKRGHNAQDEATRATFSQQLNLHASLTRKMKSIKESSSTDDSSDDMSASSDEDNAAKLINKAKEKTLKVLDGDEELPKSGVLSLPFMVRGLKKKKEAADEEAKLALEEYESSLTQLENKSASGRRAYGVSKKMVKETRKKDIMNNYYGNSDSESDVENATQYDQMEKSLFKRVEGDEDFEPKATYEVSYMTSNSWKKIKRSSDDVKGPKESNNVGNSEVAVAPTQHDQNSEQDNDEDSDTDSGEEMVDGILTCDPKSSYQLPSQAELIQWAFAGDDIKEDIEKDKDEFLNEENPEPEKPVLIPGWGQWTDVQKKKGLPSWMWQEHESAKKKRLESLKKRKMRTDKKAEK